MKIKLDEGAYKPLRAHATDAGLDLRTPVDVTVPAHGSVVVDTLTHVELPHGCAGLLVSKSAPNVRDCITSTGLIDEGYTGSIVVKLYSCGATSHKFLKGDKIAQLVILPYQAVEFNEVEELSDTQRGEGGFGSTGIGLTKEESASWEQLSLFNKEYTTSNDTYTVTVE